MTAGEGHTRGGAGRLTGCLCRRDPDTHDVRGFPQRLIRQAATNAVTVVAVALLLTRETPAGRATTMTLNGGAPSLGIALGSALGGVALAGYPAVGFCTLLLCAVSAVLVWWSGRHPAALPSAVAPPAIDAGR